MHLNFRLQLELHRSARFYFGIKCNVKQAVGDKTKEAPFRTPATDLLESTNIEEELHRHFAILETKLDSFVRNGLILINELVFDKYFQKIHLFDKK